MTVKKAVFDFFDSADSGRISGWKLFDAICSITGRHSYPTTLLNYAREYADITGAEFKCVDTSRSIYEFKKGFALNGALLGGIE